MRRNANIGILAVAVFAMIAGFGEIVVGFVGRIYLVATGVAPSSGADAIKIVIGGAIALAIILYALSQWNKLDRWNGLSGLTRGYVPLFLAFPHGSRPPAPGNETILSNCTITPN